MIKKATFPTLLLLLIAGSVWGKTSHKEMAGIDLSNCQSCHEPAGAPATHGTDWLKSHKLFGPEGASNCADCHQQSYCIDCHEGGGLKANIHRSRSGPDYLPLSHKGDFRETHPIKAKASPRSCDKCHDSRRFCNSCHAKFNRADLAFQSHRKSFTDLDVKSGGPAHGSFDSSNCQTCHPNSILPKHQWTGTHAREARKNLKICESCHPRAEVCLKCHSAMSGLKKSPHPQNWNKISGKLQRASNKRTCLKCHPK